MAALIPTDDPRTGTGVTGIPNSDPVTGMMYGGDSAQRWNTAASASDLGEAIKSRMPTLVKGAGFVGEGSNKPLSDYTTIMSKSAQAALDVRMTTMAGFQNKAATVASLNQGWLNQFGAFKTALLQMSPKDYVDQLVSLLPQGGEAIKSFAAKSFTAGNLGIGSVYGLTPFNLLAPQLR